MIKEALVAVGLVITSPVCVAQKHPAEGSVTEKHQFHLHTDWFLHEKQSSRLEAHKIGVEFNLYENKLYQNIPSGTAIAWDNTLNRDGLVKAIKEAQGKIAGFEAGFPDHAPYIEEWEKVMKKFSGKQSTFIKGYDVRLSNGGGGGGMHYMLIYDKDAPFCDAKGNIKTSLLDEAYPDNIVMLDVVESHTIEFRAISSTRIGRSLFSPTIDCRGWKFTDDGKLYYGDTNRQSSDQVVAYMHITGIKVLKKN